MKDFTNHIRFQEIQTNKKVEVPTTRLDQINVNLAWDYFPKNNNSDITKGIIQLAPDWFIIFIGDYTGDGSGGTTYKTATGKYTIPATEFVPGFSPSTYNYMGMGQLQYGSQGENIQIGFSGSSFIVETFNAAGAAEDNAFLVMLMIRKADTL